MSKREVWVVEGRRKGRGRELWRPQVAPVERAAALVRLKSYQENNIRYEFRVTKYTPTQPSATALRMLRALAKPPQSHDDGEGNKHSGSRGDCGRCQ